VGAHFDCVGGDGIIDNWSGAVLLPTLFEFAAGTQRRHAFEFVGFAAEEEGLLGSRAYLKSISKADRGQIAAVIVMDSLGLSSTKCWVNGSTKELVGAAAHVAGALRLAFSGVNVDGVATTDSQPFKDAHIPVLCLHSVTQETLQIVNGDRDTWRSVSWSDYYDTYKLISALLRYLDETLP
jgi:Zn-dependent M28 family amino/carboxypeptidase